MGNADRRFSRKMRQRRGQAKLKARIKRKAEAARKEHQAARSAKTSAAE